MEPKKYPLSVLERLCDSDIGGRLPWHVLEDDGLWLKPRMCVSPSVERDVMEWHPHEDEELAALPVPFTAAELAAFMLAGGGLFLLESFEDQFADVPEGSFPDPLDEDALDRLGPNSGQAREAIREAHRLLRLSTERFGRGDGGARSAAEWLLSRAVAASGDAAKATSEPPAQRRQRRLARLRQLGGHMRRAGDGWQVTGRRGALAALVREEAAAGRPMADKTDVRADLAAAAAAAVEMGDQRGT